MADYCDILLLKAQQGDAFVDTQRHLLADKVNCPARHSVASNWAILDDILRYKGRIYVPNTAPVRAEILLGNHDDPYAGHFRAHKTLELLQHKYFWPRIAEDVKRCIKDCKTCNCTKAARYKPYVLPPPQESMDNGPSLFDYGLDDPYNDLINDFDPYLEYGEGYQNRTAFEDAFYG